MEIYANDHAGKFPAAAGARTSEEALDALVPRYTVDTAVFICPGAKDSPLPAGESFRQHKISYAYYMGRRAADAQQVLMSDQQVDTRSKAAGEYAFSSTGKPPGNNHGKLGGNFLFCDGRVEAAPARVPFSLVLTQGVVLLNPNAQMKIQCSCGAKYAFDVSPEMAKNPVRFVCPACGLDASDFVNSLVRQELGLSGPAAATPAAGAGGDPGSTSAPPPPVARVRVHAPEAGPAEAEPAPPSAPQRCLKHPDQFTTDKCHVCSKPICPKCMELFGYVCSPLCKGKAESQGIAIPVYAGQKSVVEARAWRRTVRVAAAVGGLAVVLLGVWFWYAWFGSVPKVVWSVRFPEPVLFRPVRLLRPGPDRLSARGPPGAARHEAEEGSLVAPPGGQAGRSTPPWPAR